MNYTWEIDSLTSGTLHPIAPSPIFTPEIGQKVRLRSPYNQSKFYSVVGVAYPDLTYEVTGILDDHRNTPTVQVSATKEVSENISDPFPGVLTYRPHCEVETGYLEPYQD